MASPKKTADYFAKDPALVEKLVRKNTVYRGRMVNFNVDDILLPDGGLATREYMDHPGAVGVLPFLDQKTIVLVRQYRYPVGEVTLEMPAGKLDKGEKPLPCVRRELAEETGYTAKRVVPLIDYWPTSAFANEVLHLYVATGLTPGRHHPDEDEFIEPVVLPFKEALELVRKGKIRDSKTIIGLLVAATWRRW
ncbi:MAG: NUDIX hydrolase [Elusimicrobiota bacterium]